MLPFLTPGLQSLCRHKVSDRNDVNTGGCRDLVDDYCHADDGPVYDPHFKGGGTLFSVLEYAISGC